jgi:hypothetical protein
MERAGMSRFYIQLPAVLDDDRAMLDTALDRLRL